MSFGWPAALFGLLALIVPPWVHLRRQRQLTRRLVSIARYVPASSPPKRWRYQFEHPGLMLLRMLLVAAVVLWLADPFVRDAKHGAGDTWTLVSPAADRARVEPLLEAPNARWLAPGLPALNAPRPPMPSDGAWPYVWAADRAAPAGAAFVVVGPAVAAQATARRPVLGRDLRWIQTTVEPGTLASSPPALALLLAADAAREADVARFRRVVAAWRDAGLDVTVDEQPPAAVDAIDRPTVWLSTRPLPTAAAQPVPAPMAVVLTDVARDGVSGVGERPITLDARANVLAWEHIANGLKVRRVPALAQADGPWQSAEFADVLLALLLEGAPWMPAPDAPVAPQSLIPRVEQALVPVRSLVPALLALALALAIGERLLAARILARENAR